MAAALLHDVGHFAGAVTGRRTDGRHRQPAQPLGADWLARWFGPEVTEPVRLHVAAKRYLCAVEPGYHDRLSEASLYTLRVQGGPMSPAQAAQFAALPGAADAVAVRRWDEEAKDPDAPTPPFEHFLPLLTALLRG